MRHFDKACAISDTSRAKTSSSSTVMPRGKIDQLADCSCRVGPLKVEVIVTTGTTGSLAAKQATSTVPIVMATGGDPVREGLIASLARPGGNITGLTTFLRT